MNSPKIMRLSAKDDVVVALEELPAGTLLTPQGPQTRETIPAGHKAAVRDLAAGQPVRKYEQVIGLTKEPIPAGAWVHTHNLAMPPGRREETAAGRAPETRLLPPQRRAGFQGFVRPDGRVGTRNYLGVIPTVNCAAGVAQLIARSIPPEELARHPNLDGVLALAHGTGCGMPFQGDGMLYLQRVVAGYARHPNFAGVLVVGLGCEQNQWDSLCNATGLAAGDSVAFVEIQGSGGSAKAVERGRAILEQMLARADEARRREVSADRLVVGLECGGSDAFSGITANPALGVAADLLVEQGATVILSETPEIYGAEHLLTRRAKSPEVAHKLMALIRKWEDYAERHGGSLDNNPTPGNKAGGITTILEKSLGAVAKGGRSALNQVYGYAEPVDEPGLVFMDTPGYDPVSITGLAAGGANLVCFTTGRGSVFGGRPVPTLKLASNRETYRRLEADMDLDCGKVLEGVCDLEQMGREIFQRVLETASGRPTKGEALNLGEAEFVPWPVDMMV